MSKKPKRVRRTFTAEVKRLRKQLQQAEMEREKPQCEIEKSDALQE